MYDECRALNDVVRHLARPFMLPAELVIGSGSGLIVVVLLVLLIVLLMATVLLVVDASHVGLKSSLPSPLP